MSKYKRSHIENLALSTSLQASGLPSNFQRDIVAGSYSHLDINNGKPYVSKVRKHICALTSFGKSDNITGKHIKDVTKAHKLEIGCGGTLFENNLPILEK